MGRRYISIAILCFLVNSLFLPLQVNASDKEEIYTIWFWESRGTLKKLEEKNRFNDQEESKEDGKNIIAKLHFNINATREDYVKNSYPSSIFLFDCLDVMALGNLRFLESKGVSRIILKQEIKDDKLVSNILYIEFTEEVARINGVVDIYYKAKDSQSRGNKCPKCNGTGLMPVLCPHFQCFVQWCTQGCNATTCETCGGSGTVSSSYFPCPRCKGRGWTGSCIICGKYINQCSHGPDWRICYTCNKNGIVSNTYMGCPRCEGKGETTACLTCGLKFLTTCSHGVSWYSCNPCSQKGIIANQYIACPKCGGRGEYNWCPICKKVVSICSHQSISHWYTCPTCNQTGRVSNQYQKCPICNGWGMIGDITCSVCCGKGIIEK